MHRPADVDDGELLARARAGDAEAFGVFYRRRHGDVLSFLSRRVPSPEIAADVMCETFAKALIAVHRQDQELPELPVGWLLTIARNELIDSIRRGRVADDTRRRLAMEPLELSDGDLLAVEDAAADADVLERLRHVLGADQLAALAARVLDGREYPDIAHELQTSESVVRKRVSRALAQLRAIREGAS